MKMTLRASLSTSTKEVDIYCGDPLLYVRAKEGSHRFPELYTTDGCEIVISELTLDITNKMSGQISRVVEKMAKEQIKSIALLKLEKGKMVTNTGKVYTRDRKTYETTYQTIDRDEITVKQGKNFGFQINGKVVTTKGINQYAFFAENGIRVSFLGILKYTSTILDVFHFFDWARDPKSSLSIPFVPNFIVGMALESVFQDIDDGFEKLIQDRLKKAKEEGIDAVRRFVNSWRKGSGVDFEFMKISTETASGILQGKYKTLSKVVELCRYGEDTDVDSVYILYRIVDDPKWYLPKAIIETFFM